MKSENNTKMAVEINEIGLHVFSHSSVVFLDFGFEVNVNENISLKIIDSNS